MRATHGGPGPWARALLLWIALGALLFWFLRQTAEPAFKRVPYTVLVAAIADDHVQAVEMRPDEIRATLRDDSDDAKKDKQIVATRIPNIDESELVELMLAHRVLVTGRSDSTNAWSTALWAALPWLALPLVLWWVGSGRRGRGRPITFGQTTAKLYDRSAENRVTFADVAGVDEARAELTEIVGFLKEPQRYRSIGAHVPKGVLLVGAPGTGKTLLAKAVAGESGVPFFSMSGSEFVEMFVGVGASRVRDLFEQAKGRAPCIIFIDELDAVGKARSGAQGFVANEEREQTLNQLLVEMDGFDSGSGLIIMAATNRPEILDRALLRAGRFDRQVLVDRPDVRGRAAILAVHAKKLALAPDVELTVIAQRTPGMVGADLANVVNEAALASVRRGAKAVAAQDFEEAIDRIQLGLKKEGRVMTDDERWRIASHEAGHALVALSLAHADPVHRVTIISRSIGALGATLQLPTQERYLMTREELLDRLCVLLAGRGAEETLCGDSSTGASDDLERATELARQMVCRFGMSANIGPLTLGVAGAGLQGPAWPGELLASRTFSEDTFRVVDSEVKMLIEREHDRAREILTLRRPVLESIARELLARETLQRAELDAIISAHEIAGTSRTAPGRREVA